MLGAMIEGSCVFHNRAILGEGVFWSPSMRRVYWVDIHSGEAHRFDPVSGENRSVEVGQPIGALVERRGGGLVAA